MKTRKIAALVLSMAIAVSMLMGCGGSTSTESEKDTTASTTNETAAFTTVNEGVLTMATNAQFPPYEFYDGQDIVGIDAEIAKAVADKLGLELKIEYMEFNSIIGSVQSGKVDMGLAGMTVTEERKQSVNFTESYATGIQSIIDNEPAKAFVADNEGLAILDTEYTVEEYAACLSKDNEALLTAVDGAIKELKADGTIQAILDKYIASE
jgi:polar amino acid transport system substrate-binding protein